LQIVAIVVAMANAINSTKAAALIEQSVPGRRCSRQNLEKLCAEGALKGSPCILGRSPWRIDAETVVAEYLANVSPVQSEARQPRALRPVSDRTAKQSTDDLHARTADDDEVPSFNDERARHEREKRLIAELERRTKEGELVYRADFVTAQNAVAAQIMNRAEALPRQIKQVIPHLLIEEVEKIEALVKEMMEGVANWTYDKLEEGE